MTSSTNGQSNNEDTSCFWLISNVFTNYDSVDHHYDNFKYGIVNINYSLLFVEGIW